MPSLYPTLPANVACCLARSSTALKREGRHTVGLPHNQHGGPTCCKQPVCGHDRPGRISGRVCRECSLLPVGSRQQRPHEPKATANTPKARGFDAVSARHFLQLTVLARVHHLANGRHVTVSAQRRGNPVECPPQRVLGEHIRVHGDVLVGEWRQRAERIAIVPRSAKDVEDVSRLTEAFPACLRTRPLERFFSQAVSVPLFGLTREAERPMPPQEDAQRH